MKDDPTYLRRLRRQIDLSDLLYALGGLTLGVSLCLIAIAIFRR